MRRLKNCQNPQIFKLFFLTRAELLSIVNLEGAPRNWKAILSSAKQQAEFGQRWRWMNNLPGLPKKSSRKAGSRRWSFQNWSWLSARKSSLDNSEKRNHLSNEGLQVEFRKTRMRKSECGSPEGYLGPLILIPRQARGIFVLWHWGFLANFFGLKWGETVCDGAILPH